MGEEESCESSWVRRLSAWLGEDDFDAREELRDMIRILWFLLCFLELARLVCYDLPLLRWMRERLCRDGWVVFTILIECSAPALPQPRLLARASALSLPGDK